MLLMFSFTNDERAYLTEMRSITTDTNGNEILVGLTLEETAFYMGRARQFLTGDRDRHNADRYLELHDKHEAARFGVLGAEIYLRNENPPLH
jgi:hypothetical protein